MARKFVITSDTRLNGKPLSAGEVLEIDESSKSDIQSVVDLSTAGRIVEHGSNEHKEWEASQPKKAEAKAK